jgi:hypothetical protein
MTAEIQIGLNDDFHYTVNCGKAEGAHATDDGFFGFEDNRLRKTVIVWGVALCMSV